jgi:predicted dehydrogenase
MRKLRYGIIGAGNISPKHLDGYFREGDHVEIVAVCDIIESRAQEKARKYAIESVYTDYRQLLARSDIDFVSVCLPNYLHAPVAIEAMEAGKHVHCEKPMALNGKLAAEMLNASRKTGKKLMVGVNNRFTPQSIFTKRYIQSGKLGKIYYSRCGWVRRAGLSYSGWFCDKELAGGGPLVDLGVHFIDLVLYFMDYPAMDSIVARTFSKFGVDDEQRQLYTFEGAKADFSVRYSVEDFATGFLNLKNDSSLNFEISWASNIEHERRFYEILGDKGGIRYEDGAPKPVFKIFSREEDQFIDIEPKVKTDAYNVSEFGHFIDCVLNDREPVISPPEQAVEMMRLIDGAYASAAQGGRQIVFGPENE